ncbi:hypothetical protein BJ322DRAFT_1017851 [Thelephora terrestris]|uniref:Uncharacterized protein n=1 Tax=Thelephora terrestris TaxID=56493 RepID=A0A9P6HRR6_9AGAM|nr:hypothetical protein BJ322DRAFT_1017851 [Thelephora terrestris]
MVLFSLRKGALAGSIKDLRHLPKGISFAFYPNILGVVVLADPVDCPPSDPSSAPPATFGVNEILEYKEPEIPKPEEKDDDAEVTSIELDEEFLSHVLHLLVSSAWNVQQVFHLQGRYPLWNRSGYDFHVRKFGDYLPSISSPSPALVWVTNCVNPRFWSDEFDIDLRRAHPQKLRGSASYTGPSPAEASIMIRSAAVLLPKPTEDCTPYAGSSPTKASIIAEWFSVCGALGLSWAKGMMRCGGLRAVVFSESEQPHRACNTLFHRDPPHLGTNPLESAYVRDERGWVPSALNSFRLPCDIVPNTSRADGTLIGYYPSDTPRPTVPTPLRLRQALPVSHFASRLPCSFTRIPQLWQTTAPYYLHLVRKGYTPRKQLAYFLSMPYTQALNLSYLYEAFSEDLNPLFKFNTVQHVLRNEVLPNGDIILRRMDGVEATFDVIGVITEACCLAPHGLPRLEGINNPLFAECLAARNQLYTFMATAAGGDVSATLSVVAQLDHPVDIAPLDNEVPIQAAIRNGHGQFVFSADNQIFFFGDDVLRNGEIVRCYIRPASVKEARVARISMSPRLILQPDGSFRARQLLKSIHLVHEELTMACLPPPVVAGGAQGELLPCDD